MTRALNLPEPAADTVLAKTDLPASETRETLETLSAWMDGAPVSASPSEGEPWVGQADRATWDAYHLIGDVMRSADLAITPTPAFSVRLARALEAEPAHRGASIPQGAQAAQPGVARPKFSRFGLTRLRFARRGLALPGLALAAALAWLVWAVQPLLWDSATDPFVLAEAQGMSARRPAAVAGLHDYLDAHRQMVGASVVRQVAASGADVRGLGLRHASLRPAQERDGVTP